MSVRWSDTPGTWVAAGGAGGRTTRTPGCAAHLGVSLRRRSRLPRPTQGAGNPHATGRGWPRTHRRKLPRWSWVHSLHSSSYLVLTPEQQGAGGNAFSGGHQARLGSLDLRSGSAAHLLHTFGDEVEPVDVGLGH